MGRIRFVVDPKAINPAQVQSWINDLYALPGIQQYLSYPSDLSIVLTDYHGSLGVGNQQTVNEGLSRGIRGFAQQAGTDTIWINRDPADGKSFINTLIHEIGHFKWQGLGTNNAHDPQFYKLLNDTLIALGRPVDPTLDLNDVPISSVTSPAGNNPLGYVRAKCFAAGTPILMADGSEKPIEQISVGDVVMAFDTNDGLGLRSLEPRVVQRTFQNVADQLLHLTLSNNKGVDAIELFVTPGHHFLSSDGSFRRIDEIIRNSGKAVLKDGSFAEVSANVVDLLTFTCCEEELLVETVYDIEGALAPSPSRKLKVKTYNFEVEGCHTYVAGGVKVHNDSVFEYLPDDAILIGQPVYDSQGFPREIDYIRASDGVEVHLVGADLDGNPITTERLHETLIIPPTAGVIDGARIVQVRDFQGGKESDRRVTSLEYDGTVIQAEQIGTILGSHLGKTLGGDNLLVNVGASTVLATLMGNVGEFLQKGIDIALVGNWDGRALSTNPIRDAANITMADLGHDFVNNLQGQVTGVLSSILTAELADLLNLDGFAEDGAITVADTITRQFLDNVAACIDANSTAGLFAGFDNPDLLLANLGSAFGGLAGNHLADTVITADSPEAALFGSAAAALGSYGAGVLAGSIGTALTSAGLALIPVAGPFLAALAGTFVGKVVGTWIGNQVISDKDPQLEARTFYNKLTGQFEGEAFGPYQMPANSAQIWEAADGLADYVADGLNDVSLLVDGTIDARRLPMVTRLKLNEAASGDWAINGTGFTEAREWTQGASTALVSANLDVALAGLNLVGMDPIVSRAFYASRDEGMTRLAMDIQVARDYQLYMDNVALVNALIAGEPDSPLALGWLTTLKRAEELKLGDIGAEDHRGGIFANLEGKGIGDKLNWTAELDPDNPDAVVLTHLNHRFTMEHVWGPGPRLPEAQTRGTTGNDVTTFAEQAQLAVLGYDAGGGNDNVTGHVGTDFLKGGAGRDTLKGGF